MNQALFVWLILCLIWSSTWIFIKLGLRDLPPMTFAGLRFLIAASILWLIVWARRSVIPNRLSDWVKIAWTGLITFGLNYGLVFWGEQRITSGLAAVLQAMIPVFGLFIAHYFLPSERISLRKLAGVSMGVVGVGVIFYDQIEVEGKFALWGCVALLMSALSIAYSNVFIKARLQHVDPAALAAGQMVCGFVPLLLVGALWEGSPFTLNWTWLSVLAIVYLAVVGSSIAFLLYYWLLKKIDVTKTMLIALVTPALALLIGMIVLNEPVTWRLAAGSIAILAGISLIIVQKKMGVRS